VTQFPDKWSKLNVVLCHDWLTGMRGGEAVLQILCEAFPNAPIYTLIHNSAAVSEKINAHKITTSWLQNVPGIMKNYRYFLPFFPGAIEGMTPPTADILISTSHCVAKGLIPRPGTKHLCYCFTPMRYAWTFYEEYFGRSPVKAMFARLVLPSLRKWDKDSSSRVHRFVTLSHHVKKRIKDFYGRESDVVYPPVDTARLTPSRVNEHRDFDLIVSALVPYKRIDLAVRAYSRSGHPLKVVGVGTETAALKAIAAPNIEFLGWQSDEAVLELYRTCRMLIFPGEEDFGLVPIEAQACGKPVVAYGKGGVLESLKDGVTGVFFDQQVEESLLAGVEKCAGMKWDADAIRANAERFSVDNFVDGLAESIEKCLAG
jgi:glycosyltransferase involved in cell wall biosynthesis